MNPSHGEISRAMRNRGIEICILPEVRKYAVIFARPCRQVDVAIIIVICVCVFVCVCVCVCVCVSF